MRLNKMVVFKKICPQCGHVMREVKPDLSLALKHETFGKCFFCPKCDYKEMK